LLKTIPNSRLVVPAPELAWVLIVVGLALIVWGTMCAMKVRRAMNEETGALGPLVNHGRSNLGYLLNDYVDDDKPLLLLGLAGRMIGGLMVVWAGIGLFVG
jgi:hypothetical protein